MRFGIFDHMDKSDVPLNEQYESRLQLIEAYEKAGFYAYHLAEHHGTPLGCAPSPGVFLAAVAQRTRSLRFGPLVYILPLYHPVRLIEEICMLDQMSGGRFELGVGRGISPVEVSFYGADPVHGPKQFGEALEVIKNGLSSVVLNHHGDFYNFQSVPIVMQPVQRPHPPLWCGVKTIESATWAAANDVNIVTLSPASAARDLITGYRSEWDRLGKPASRLPFLGICRHIVLAEDAEEAKETARRAYRPWRENLELLWRKHGLTIGLTLPPEFDTLQSFGGAYAGRPEGARTYIEEQTKLSGANYFVCDISFGNITQLEAMRTVQLLARDVLPTFRQATAVAAN